MRTLLLIGLLAILHPHASAVDIATTDDSADARLAYMQETGKAYRVQVGAGNNAKSATFRSKPVLRWTNPVSGVVDGGLFVWEDQSKRPVAAAQIFIAPNTKSLWLHEFQSLSTRPLKFVYEGRIAWGPDSAGVEFQPVAGTMRPAATPAARLLQMRRIVRRFSVKDNFEGAEKDQLRIMSTPLVRYKDDETEDGALFTFAHGTDPELLVMIEMRKNPSEPNQMAWHVALAPMTSYAITARFDDQEYWSVPWRKAPMSIDATFKNFAFPPR